MGRSMFRIDARKVRDAMRAWYRLKWLIVRRLNGTAHLIGNMQGRHQWRLKLRDGRR